MEHIVLGYDGTPASLAALRWVSDRAAREVATVHVVTVLSRFTRDRASALVQLGDAEEYLREHAPGVGVELHRLEGGVRESLIEASQRADALVVGVNPGHPVEAMIAGALPLRLSSEANVPVVMVPSAWVDPGAPVTVGVATDSSSEPATLFAGREADRTGVAVRLVHAWRGLAPVPTPVPNLTGSGVLPTSDDAEQAIHRRILDRAAQHLLDRYATMDVRRELVNGERTVALLGYSARSSLIVIGTHHRGLVEGGLLGSVARSLMWHVACPLAVVPGHAPALAETGR